MNFNERINMEESGTMVPCKKCLGTKNLVRYINTKMLDGTTYCDIQFDYCGWCNYDGKVDWLKQLMGKKYYEY